MRIAMAMTLLVLWGGFLNYLVAVIVAVVVVELVGVVVGLNAAEFVAAAKDVQQGRSVVGT